MADEMSVGQWAKIREWAKTTKAKAETLIMIVDAARSAGDNPSVRAGLRESADAAAADLMAHVANGGRVK